VPFDPPGYDDDTMAYLGVFGFFESRRRAREFGQFPALEEFEKGYHGIEVGSMRRYFNQELYVALDWEKPLLDIGCGGTWWKDEYWPRLPKVYGVEVVPEVLLALRHAFPDVRKYHLIYSPTGLTELTSESLPQILSSSVIGYILPKQAECHLKECWRLLEPGGRLFLVRINACRYRGFLRAGLSEIDGRPGSFNYSYRKNDLFRLLARCCPGHSVEVYRRMGFLLPHVSAVAIQKLYSLSVRRVVDRAVNRVFPFLSIHHFVVLRKC